MAKTKNSKANSHGSSKGASNTQWERNNLGKVWNSMRFRNHVGAKPWAKFTKLFEEQGVDETAAGAIAQHHMESSTGAERPRRAGGVIAPHDVIPVQNMVPVQMKAIPGAIAEAACWAALHCFDDNILTGDTILIGITNVGTLWLGTQMLAYEIWRAIGGKTPFISRHPEFFNQFLDACRQKVVSRSSGPDNAQEMRTGLIGTVPEDFFGSEGQGLFVEFPLTVGRRSKISISWVIDSLTGDLATVVPSFDEELLQAWGPVALNRIYDRLVLGRDINLTNSLNSTSYAQSAALFVNTISLHNPTPDITDGRWGSFGSPIVIPESERWLSAMEMFEYNPELRTPEIFTGFIGMHGWFDRCLTASTDRVKRKFNIREVALEGVLNDISTSSLLSDIIANGIWTRPGGGLSLAQGVESAFYEIGATDWLYYVAILASRAFSSNWVAAFSMDDETAVMVGAGWSAVNSFIDAYLPEDVMIRWDSLVPDFGCIEKGFEIRNYTPLTCRGKVLAFFRDSLQNIASPESVPDLTIPLLYPEIDIHSWEWGADLGVYDDQWIDPFDFTRGFTRGQNVWNMNNWGNDFMGNLANNITLGDANGLHETDRSLSYYAKIVSMGEVVDQYGFSLYGTAIVHELCSDENIDPEEAGSNFMGTLPTIILKHVPITIDISPYRFIYRCYYDLLATDVDLTEVLNESAFSTMFARDIVHTKWAATLQVYSNAVDMMISRSHGGGKGFFSRVWDGIKSVGKFLARGFKAVAPMVGPLIDRLRPGAGTALTALSNAIASTYENSTFRVRGRPLLDGIATLRKTLRGRSYLEHCDETLVSTLLKVNNPFVDV